MRTQASWYVHIAQLLSLLIVRFLSISLSLSRLLYVQILPPAIKITVVMFLLTAKYSFRFDCTSTDMNGRGKKRPTKRSTANEGFCVLLKLRWFSPPTCDGLSFHRYQLMLPNFLFVSRCITNLKFVRLILAITRAAISIVVQNNINHLWDWAKIK